jgi:hypothetical protein
MLTRASASFSDELQQPAELRAFRGGHRAEQRFFDDGGGDCRRDLVPVSN